MCTIRALLKRHFGNVIVVYENVSLKYIYVLGMRVVEYIGFYIDVLEKIRNQFGNIIS